MTYRADNGKFAKCPVCLGKRYLVSTRDDGREAIERCDECAWYGDDDPRTLHDTDAAKLAAKDGFVTDPDYPCIIRQRPLAVRHKDLAYAWELLKRITTPISFV